MGIPRPAPSHGGLGHGRSGSYRNGPRVQVIFLSEQELSTAKAPAFQFYPKDYESDEHVKLMSLAQEGVYLRLMCHQWLHGSVPSDMESLARICRTTPKEMRKLWPGVAPCFPEIGDGRLANKRMAKDIQAAHEYREAASAAGKNGSRKRWGSDRVPHPQVIGSQAGNPTPTPMRSDNSPSPSATASPTPTRNESQVVRPDFAPKPNPFIRPGERPKWENEALALTEQIALLMDLDGVEVFQKASGYTGARTSKCNPANLTEDRLVNTVTDLRKMLKQAQDRVADKERRGNV